ncbi:hypothetical protein KSP39_PZI002329 [Platanthera zijinensis]|uniref:CCHC-type domain-containing protein n=1 Tax=Platanthera zijinensis TaxID=2320716 RepID=A0AAP0GDV6_9ASPA
MEGGFARDLGMELVIWTNFGKWKSCMECYLLGKDLWDVVCGDRWQVVTAGNAEVMRAWKETNVKEVAVLKQVISSKLLDNIGGCRSAAEIWTSLDGLFNKEVKLAPEVGPSTSDQQERSVSPRYNGKWKEGPRCYRCKQPGHLKEECKVILHSVSITHVGSKEKDLGGSSKSSDADRLKANDIIAI